MSMSGRLDKLPAPVPSSSGWPWTEETDPEVYQSRADWPRITIVTPSYNQAQFIEETIRSILLQNYPNLQYIIIDAGSTDGTLEIMEKYSPWIDTWVSEPDRGQSHAINKGLQKADGEWFNWINSDDFLLPKGLLTIATGISDNPQSLLVAGRVKVLAGQSSPLPKKIKISGDLEDDIVNHRTAQPGMFYRTSFISHFEESLHFAMDYALWVQLLAREGTSLVATSDDLVSCFRIHENSKTGGGQEKFEREERRILASLLENLNSSQRFIRALAGNEHSKLHFCQTHVNRRKLEATVATRFLLGDLEHRQFQHTRACTLFAVCLRSIPLKTINRTIRGFLKWLLGRP